MTCLDNSPSPFDQDDKEVAESMSCTTNYPIQFEACEGDLMLVL